VTHVGRLHELAEAGFAAAEIRWQLSGFELELFEAHSRPTAGLQTFGMLTLDVVLCGGPAQTVHLTQC
jgi:hypothetical protein